ncbi:MAG: hypothetical protein JW724_07080 [Candidatus Altiarchaeota archaeon]|nr:hypothetical protein [Candidatus Altiarchaeota archaeon]
MADVVIKVPNERLERVSEVEKKLGSSMLTQEQADELAEKISCGLARRYITIIRGVCDGRRIYPETA